MSYRVYRDDHDEIWLVRGEEAVLIDDAMYQRIVDKIGSVPAESLRDYQLRELTEPQPAPSAPVYRPDQLLGARHDTPDMTGKVLGFEPLNEPQPAPVTAQPI